MTNNIFSEDEINEITEIICNDYSQLSDLIKNPKKAIKTLANTLSEYNFNIDKKLSILECAIRIKYEIKLTIDTNYSLSLNRYYFKFKKNDFIIKSSITMINNYDFDFISCLPPIIQKCLNNAFCKTINKQDNVFKLTKEKKNINY